MLLLPGMLLAGRPQPLPAEGPSSSPGGSGAAVPAAGPGGWLRSRRDRSDVTAEQRGGARGSPVLLGWPGGPPQLPLGDDVIGTRSALNEFALGKLHKKCCQVGHKQEFRRGQRWV